MHIRGFLEEFDSVGLLTNNLLFRFDVGTTQV